jgi:hypothetical protein
MREKRRVAGPKFERESLRERERREKGVGADLAAAQVRIDLSLSSVAGVRIRWPETILGPDIRVDPHLLNIRVNPPQSV